MACCSPFKAAATRPIADPGLHVNFVTGMVLGVDDHVQEFAYLSGRDRAIVRAFLGYGTLVGLALTVEADGANGPRMRVSPGFAAAPSGQLICVGREQCGSLNPWLARPEVIEKLGTTIAAGATAATLNLFLTLCYVDCAVAEVPIPGEPCRSDENLMAPSRIADDYCLDFCFEPPPMTEAAAIAALNAFWATLNIAGTNSNTQASFEAAVLRAEQQLRLALGVPDPAAPAPGAGDLDPIKLHTAGVARFGARIRQLWVTTLLPLVAVPRCGAVEGQDCLLLGRLTVPVIKAGNHWEVAGPPAGKPHSVGLDESERPLLLAANAAQTPIGPATQADGRDQKVAFMSATGTSPIGSGLLIVRGRAPITVTLPAASPGSRGRTLTVKAAEAGVVKLAVAPANNIDGAATLTLPARGAVSLISDGADTWHVTGQTR